jgi:hypothetical protein
MSAGKMSSLTLLRRRTALRLLHARALLGPIGLAAMLLLAGAGAAIWWAPRVVDDTTLLRAQTAAESTRARARLLDIPPDPAAQMAQFREWFPQGTRNVEDLRTIFRVAKRQQVQLLRGDYVAGRQPETRLATYDVVLPVRANYAAIRGFVASVLNDLPHASLVDLRMERASGELLDARVHLTLFYREN